MLHDVVSYQAKAGEPTLAGKLFSELFPGDIENDKTNILSYKKKANTL